MAVGDAVGDVSSINAGATLTIQPGAGVEWIIHNIYHAAEAELKVIKGGNELLFETSGGMGSWNAYFFHVTNAQYFKVKNTNAGAKLIGYDGIVSKE